MRPFFSAALALAFTLSFAPRAEAAVVLNTASFGGHTYLEVGGLNGTGITWQEAEAFAVIMGGHLATVNSAAENTFIADTFNPGNNEWLWIGLNDLASYGNFTWSSGTTSGYTNFTAGEPSLDGGPGFQHGVHLWSGSVGDPSVFTRYKWNDFPAGEMMAHQQYFHGIVEINGAVPEPASLLLVAGAAGAALVRRSHRRA